jgi:hypothetical protein
MDYMNLNDCLVPYKTVGIEVLALKTQSAVLKALEVYGTQDCIPLIDRSLGSTSIDRQRRYQQTKLSDIRRELIRAHVVTEDLEFIPPAETFMVPSQFDYSTLGFAELKVLFVCYMESKHSRTPFRFQVLRESIAEKAHLSLVPCRRALESLAQRKLILIEQKWREGVLVTLLDPLHGETTLYSIGKFYRDQMTVLPVHERYRYLLKDYDPRQALANMHSPVRDYGLVCPFCYGGSQAENKRRFRFNSEDDKWFCHNCKRGGDSVRLWGRLYWRMKRNEENAAYRLLNSAVQRDASAERNI